MSTIFLYDLPILPVGFGFPKRFLQLAYGHDVPDLEPWNFLFLDMPRSLNYYGAMLQTYPEKPLIPFAIGDDQTGFWNDGYIVLACFDGDDKSGDPKIYFHDYGSAEQTDFAARYSLLNFYEWLQVTEEESARYKRDRAELEGD
jgi:hypothetical protein